MLSYRNPDEYTEWLFNFRAAPLEKRTALQQNTRLTALFSARRAAADNRVHRYSSVALILGNVTVFDEGDEDHAAGRVADCRPQQKCPWSPSVMPLPPNNPASTSALPTME